MSFRNLMLISSVLALAFGIGFIVVPEPLATLYGLRLEPSGIFIARLLGVEFFGFGLLAWLVRNAGDSKVSRSVLKVFLTTDALGAVVAILGQLSGILNTLGWSIVAVFLLLTLAWSYLLLRKHGLSYRTMET